MCNLLGKTHHFVSSLAPLLYVATPAAVIVTMQCKFIWQAVHCYTALLSSCKESVETKENIGESATIHLDAAAVTVYLITHRVPTGG